MDSKWDSLLSPRPALLLLALLVGCDPGTTEVDSSAMDPSRTNQEKREADLSAGSIDQEAARLQHPTRSTLSQASAVELGTAYLEEFGPFLLSRLEREHGEVIDLQALVPEQRVVLAETPYAPLPATAKNHLHKRWGSYYIVTFSDQSTPVLRVAVSALATDLRVVDGRVVYVGDEGVYGNEFAIHGVPYGADPWVRAQDAVLKAVGRTDAKPLGDPAFYRRSAEYDPVHGFWRVILKDAIPVRSSTGMEMSVKRFFVSDRGELFVGQETDRRTADSEVGARFVPDFRLEFLPVSHVNSKVGR